MALSTIQRVIKDDERLLVYALHNLVQVFIGLSNSDGEMAASELLHQVCITAMHIYMMIIMLHIKTSLCSSGKC